jgi:hypothetical protein
VRQEQFMSSQTIIAPCTGLVVVFLGACAEPKPHTQLNAPPVGHADAHPEWAEIYVYHNDQGLMADMSIADIHFLPHTAELSGTGEARLGRYAELLATIGGTLYYDTMLTNEDLVKARIRTAREFLADAVPGAKPISIVVGLPGAPGMTAREAIAGRDVAQQPEARQNAYDLQGRIRQGQQ